MGTLICRVGWNTTVTSREQSSKSVEKRKGGATRSKVGFANHSVSKASGMAGVGAWQFSEWGV